MKAIKNLVCTVVACTFITACGGGGGSSGGGSSSQSSTFTESTIVLSDVLASAEKNSGKLAAPSYAPQDCTFVSDIYSVSGTCITPTKVIGYAEQAYLQKEFGNVGGGTRILGVSEFDETPGAIFEGEAFELSNPNALVTNNTLREQYPYREQYDTISLNTSYYIVQFPLTINTGTQYVTMTLAKFAQPFASSDAVTTAMADCSLSAQEVATSRFQNADLLSGLSFNRGDYLFCVKDNESDICAAADYKWLDTADNSLVSTRPSSPKTAHALANNPVECVDEGGGRVNFNFGPFGIFATIDSTSLFKLWSDFTHGSYSNQWASESVPMGDQSIITSEIAWVSPYYIYYFQNCGSGSCGATQEGVDLEVTLQFDTDGMVLVADLTSSAIAALTNIGDALLNVHTKTQWAFDQRSINNVEGYDANDMAGLSVQPSIQLSGATNSPPTGAITLCTDVTDSSQLPDHCP